MNLHQLAKELGRRGGLKRAQRLSPVRRKSIAALGGRRRRESLQIARRIEENFRYLKVLRELSS